MEKRKEKTIQIVCKDDERKLLGEITMKGLEGSIRETKRQVNSTVQGTQGPFTDHIP